MIVISDLFGGSVNNELMNLMQKRKLYLVAGMTMSLIIQLILCVDEENVESSIQTAILEAQNSIIYCNKKLKNADEKEDF